MKRITAFIKPNMLDDVVFALHGIPEFPGAAISDVRQIGRGIAGQVRASGRAPFHGFPASIRMEIVCGDDRVEQIVETIKTKAHTGLPDDGMICVSPVEEAVQIRDGARV